MGDIVSTGTRIILSLVTIFFVDIYTAVGMAVLLIFGIFLNGRLAKTTEGFWSKYIENMRRTNYLYPRAAAFYEHMGFEVYGRSERDEQGGPYPVLYMKRRNG